MRPGRFFHDKKAQRLYYVHNDSLGTPPPASLAFSLPLVERLIVFNGTQEAPVRGVTISGLGLRDAVASYLLPHGVPSGGDWALQRSAAVFMEGTIGARLEGLAMERCDGNAVMLSGCTIHKDASSFCARASVSLTQNHELSSQPECINSPLRDSMDGRQRNCRVGEDRRAFGRWTPRVRRHRRQPSARHARGRQCHQRGRHVREAVVLLLP